VFIDAGAMVAILTEEPEGEGFAARLATAERSMTNTLAVFEATAAVFRKKRTTIERAEAQVLAFLKLTGVEVTPLGQRDTSLALQACGLYGRHRYPDKQRNRALDLADCYHYATAKTHRLSILTNDMAFAETELPICK